MQSSPWSSSEQQSGGAYHLLKDCDPAIQHTSTKHSPWYVIPADHKWFTHLTSSDIIVETLKYRKLAYPKVDDKQRKRLKQAKKALTS